MTGETKWPPAFSNPVTNVVTEHEEYVMRIRNAIGALFLAAALTLGLPGTAAHADTDLPVSGDTAALIEQLNGQLETARKLGDVSDLTTGPATYPFISPSVQDTMDLLDGMLDGDLGALGDMDGLLNGMNDYTEKSNDVYGYEQGVREPNGHSDY